MAGIRAGNFPGFSWDRKNPGKSETRQEKLSAIFPENTVNCWNRCFMHKRKNRYDDQKYVPTTERPTTGKRLAK